MDHLLSWTERQDVLETVMLLGQFKLLKSRKQGGKVHKG